MLTFNFLQNFTIHYWLEKGAPASKLVMGMPLYGQSFTLDSLDTHDLNAPARAKGRAGEFTRAPGFLAYYEICQRINTEQWSVVRDPERRMGPYAYKDKQWVGFDDVDTIRMKSEYIRSMGLGGGMVWALDLDDFNNRCGQGRHPLMKAIKSVLGPAKNENETDLEEEIFKNTEDIESNETELTEIDNSIQEQEVVMDESDEIEGYKVVCYFTNWAWYRPEGGKYQPRDIKEDLCTHIVYGFAVLDPITLTIKAHDSWADFDNGKFQYSVVKLTWDLDSGFSICFSFHRFLQESDWP